MEKYYLALTWLGQCWWQSCRVFAYECWGPRFSSRHRLTVFSTFFTLIILQIHIFHFRQCFPWTLGFFLSLPSCAACLVPHKSFFLSFSSSSWILSKQYKVTNWTFSVSVPLNRTKRSIENRAASESRWAKKTWLESWNRRPYFALNPNLPSWINLLPFEVTEKFPV